jgi:cob(I)alamin adenosyltransferase
LKCENLVGVYGTIDELNCWMGLIVSNISQKTQKDLFVRVQKDLLTIGSHLAGSLIDLSNLPVHVDLMENTIDEMEKNLPKLTHFILPGGAQTASFIHIARSITRRCERQVVKLFKQKKQDFSKDDKQIIQMYLNRLSDLLFVLSRYINQLNNSKEILGFGVDVKNKDKRNSV